MPREIKHEVLKLLPERIARQYNAVVFDVDEEGTKLVAMEDPDDIQAINFLQKQLGNNIKVHITTSSLLQGGARPVPRQYQQRADQSYRRRR